MALFSKQNKEVFTNPLNLDHPILGQVLGICSALAVTSQAQACHRDGTRCDGYHRFCECDYFDYPQHDT